MIRAFASDGTSVVGKLDKLLFGRDIDLWISEIHDWRHFVGGPEARRLKANAEMFRNCEQYSEMAWRRWHRFFFVTVGATRFMPDHQSRWNYGWDYWKGPGDPYKDGPFTVLTEWPKLLKMLADAKCPKEVLDNLQPVLI